MRPLLSVSRWVKISSIWLSVRCYSIPDFNSSLDSFPSPFVSNTLNVSARCSLVFCDANWLPINLKIAVLVFFWSRYLDKFYSICLEARWFTLIFWIQECLSASLADGRDARSFFSNNWTNDLASSLTYPQCSDFKFISDSMILLKVCA